MWKRLRRWPFDVALCVGLVLFGWATWSSKPRAMWTVAYPPKQKGLNSSLTFLQFTEDDLRFYTCDDLMTQPNHLPTPMIQCWETRTGKLLKEYPLAVPEEDRRQLKLWNQFMGVQTFMVHRTRHPDLLQSRMKKNPQLSDVRDRLYDINDGRCVSPVLPSQSELESMHYLMHDPVSGQPLALCGSQSGTDPFTIVKALTGDVVHSFPSDRQKTFMRATTTPDRQLMVLEYLNLNNHPRQRAGYLEVYRIKDWAKVSSFSLQPGFHQQLYFLNDTHWITVQMISLDNQSYDRMQLSVYRFDPVTVTLTPDESHFFHNSVYLNNKNVLLFAGFLITNTYHEPAALQDPILQKVEAWLQRVGMSLRGTSTMDYHIQDIHTGELLRQVRGLERKDYRLSHRAEYLAVANNRGEAGVSVYHLPVWWWQPLLSWVQWLSWLLVLPWPLRYLARKGSRTDGVQSVPLLQRPPSEGGLSPTDPSS